MIWINLHCFFWNHICLHWSIS